MDPAEHLPLSDLSLNILLALGSGPLHGYGIIKDIEDRTGATTNLRSGTLYLALRRMRSDGLIQPVDPPQDHDDVDERRNYFGLTEAGRQVARLELRRLRQLVTAGERRHLVDLEAKP